MAAATASTAAAVADPCQSWSRRLDITGAVSIGLAIRSGSIWSVFLHAPAYLHGDGRHGAHAVDAEDW